MTAYGDRRRAGEYDADPSNPSPQEATVYDPNTGGTTVQTAAPEPEAAPDNGGPTLKELQAEAESYDLPTYGTKAQLRERIDTHLAE